MTTTTLGTFESGWCPYCQVVTTQETTLVQKKKGRAYETTCSKCHRLLRWHLISTEGKEVKK